MQGLLASKSRQQAHNLRDVRLGSPYSLLETQAVRCAEGQLFLQFLYQVRHVQEKAPRSEVIR